MLAKQPAPSHYSDVVFDGDAADADGTDCVGMFFSISWLRRRRAIFCLRMRLYLDLSPLTLDTINSCVSGWALPGRRANPSENSRAKRKRLFDLSIAKAQGVPYLRG